MLVGGDFNSTLDARLDRSFYRKVTGHDSPGLRSILTKRSLMDALSDPGDIPVSKVLSWYDETHTYRYTLSSGMEASARLDRWYGTACLADWIAEVEVCHPGAQPDH